MGHSWRAGTLQGMRGLPLVLLVAACSSTAAPEACPEADSGDAADGLSGGRIKEPRLAMRDDLAAARERAVGAPLATDLPPLGEPEGLGRQVAEKYNCVNCHQVE